MAKKEEPTGRAARIRGGLPGEKWREHVHPGAIKAYEGPLAPSRKKASELRRKGRLVEAHRTEKGAFKIRARGYDRKYRGEKPFGKELLPGATPFGKGISVRTTKLGPYKKSVKEWRIRPLSRSEERRRNIVAAGKTIGGLRTVAALGGGAALTGVVQDSKKSAQNTGNIIRSIGTKENVVASKSLDIYQIIGKSYDDPYDDNGLVEINKVLNPWGAISRGAKDAFKGAAPKSWQEPAAHLYQGARTSYRQGFGEAGGGLKGLGEYGRAVSAPYMGAAGAGGAGVGGAGLAAGGALWAGHAAKKAVKKKALKYAGYGALGVGGAVAGGTAVGNMVSPHSRA